MLNTTAEDEFLSKFEYLCVYCRRTPPIYTLISAHRFGTYEGVPSPSSRGHMPHLTFSGKPRVCFGYHVDHVVPKAHGGSNEDANLVLACNSCNSRKRNSTLAEWLARESAPDRAKELAKTRARMKEYQARIAARNEVCERADSQDLENLLRASLHGGA